MRTRTVARPAFLIALLSCGDDSNEGDSSAGPPAAETLAVCEAHLGFVERCEGDPDFGYTKEFGEGKCRQVQWRYFKAAFVKAYAACLETLPCSEYDDVCVDSGYTAVGFQVTAILDDPLVRRCGDVAQICDTDENAEHEVGELCQDAPLLTSAGRAWFSRCLDQPCERVYACTRAP